MLQALLQVPHGGTLAVQTIATSAPNFNVVQSVAITVGYSISGGSISLGLDLSVYGLGYVNTPIPIQFNAIGERFEENSGSKVVGRNLFRRFWRAFQREVSWRIIFSVASCHILQYGVQSSLSITGEVNTTADTLLDAKDKIVVRVITEQAPNKVVGFLPTVIQWHADNTASIRLFCE